jgi:hypothetical protein
MVKVRQLIPAAALGTFAVSLVLAGAGPSAHAANTVVYRCLDAHLDVVYTDLPCKDGAAFEVRPGEADAAAVARLEKLRDQLDQSAAQRISDERRLFAQRLATYSSRTNEQPRDETSDYGGGYYYTYPVAGYGAPYPPFAKPPINRFPDRHPMGKHGGAPPPPYVVPRQ